MSGLRTELPASAARRSLRLRRAPHGRKPPYAISSGGRRPARCQRGPDHTRLPRRSNWSTGSLASRDPARFTSSCATQSLGSTPYSHAWRPVPGVGGNRFVPSRAIPQPSPLMKTHIARFASLLTKTPTALSLLQPRRSTRVDQRVDQKERRNPALRKLQQQLFTEQ